MSEHKSYLTQLIFDPALRNTLHAKWITNIRLVILLVIMVLAAGITALFTLPRRVNPEVKIPIVIVTTVLPGAEPEEVEKLATTPIEDVLVGMDGLDRITSSSRSNFSTVVLEFLSTVNRDKARDEVQSLVDGVTLPEDSQTPKVSVVDFENEPIWTFVLSGRNEASLMRFADKLKKKIEDLPPVKSVSLSGYETQEITVSLSETAIKNYKLDAQAVSRAISAAASSYPGGAVTANSSNFSVSIDSQIASVDDIRNIRITAGSTSMRLGDIAAVAEKTVPDLSRTYIGNANRNLQRAVTFQVYKNPGINIDAAAAAVETAINQEIAAHGQEFKVDTVINAGAEISTQLGDLVRNFFETLLLVFLVLLLFLGVRQAILASVTIPLTFLSGLVIMGIFGLSINFISMFAFLLALGTSIDDTIVVVSSMTSYYRSKKFSGEETGLLVWRDFIVPIWATTITTIWAFLPLLLSTGIIGEFIKSIPIVVTATMLSSTLYSVTVTLPFMIVLLQPKVPGRVKTFFRILAYAAAIIVVLAIIPKTPLFLIMLAFAVMTAYAGYKSLPTVGNLIAENKFLKNVADHGFVDSRRISRVYRRIIENILRSHTGRRNIFIVLIVFALFSYALVPLGLVKNEFFPKSDQDQIYLNVEYPAGANIDSVRTRVFDLANEIRQIKNIESLIVETGREFSGNGFDSRENTAVITLVLKEDRTEDSIMIAEKLRDKYALYEKGKVTVQELSGGPPAGSDIQLKLLGDDLQTLGVYAGKVKEYLENTPGTASVELSVKPSTSKLTFVPDTAKMADAGVGIDQIGFTMRSFLSGQTLDKIRFGEEETEVILRTSEGKKTAEELSKITIGSKNGDLPISSLGRFELTYNPSVISREAGKRTISVSGSVKPGYVASDINRQLEQFADTKLNLPSGYSWQTGGANEENAKSVQSIMRAMGLSFLLIMVTMVTIFGSYRQAAIILLLIPLAISGVFTIFALTSTPLSFPALIGIVALFGIVVTNAMFIVDSINRNLKKGMEIIEAIADAAESRMEPIILTSLTTIFGLVPITLSDPIWRGLGGAIIAGLSFSGSIMLFFVPVLYYTWFKKKN